MSNQKFGQNLTRFFYYRTLFQDFIRWTEYTRKKIEKYSFSRLPNGLLLSWQRERAVFALEAEKPRQSWVEFLLRRGDHSGWYRQVPLYSIVFKRLYRNYLTLAELPYFVFCILYSVLRIAYCLLRTSRHLYTLPTISSWNIDWIIDVLIISNCNIIHLTVLLCFVFCTLYFVFCIAHCVLFTVFLTSPLYFTNNIVMKYWLN